MVVSTTAPSRAPQRFALCAAAICVCASAGLNVAHAVAKTPDLPGKLIYGSVAAAVAVLFALSTPAAIRAFDEKRWSAAFMALLAFVLAGSYSVSAALGSASAGRLQAERAETASTGTRDRAQAAYDAAKAALDRLAPSRPTAEVQALVDSARPQCRVVVKDGRRDTVCATPAALVVELGRARERDRLQKALDKASDDLSKAPPPPANTDAKTAARFLSAVGVDVTADRLNDLLVLLTVLILEMGGTLGLSLAQALSGRPTAGAAHAPGTAQTAPTPPDTSAQIVRPLPATPPAPVQQPYTARARGPDTASEAVVQWLRTNGGRTEGVRRLAEAVGQPASTVSDRLHRLALDGRVRLARGRRGTVVELAPIGNLN